MISLIPAQYRLGAAIVAVVLLCVISGAAGMVVGEWKAGSGGAQTISALKDALIEKDATISIRDRQIADLKLAIKDQNTAIQVAQAETKKADELREQAQLFAKDMAVMSESRLAKIDKMIKQAQTADEVLEGYWEIRQ